ncbi:hypothetical protein KOW79_003820 [Hemibagrus wyckioides]|uniref:THD domain-containing protein n=1 Tax=Hemibagrus wyckioides TaxID=337641 RepID=A0A9D3SP59_9TELE|nr:lymphotoxin-alpha-like [Hemibagrus wyckioides]KAG7331986.1 hypothetical protein KOW79_003820 [Hemibagrus wyckioides]
MELKDERAEGLELREAYTMLMETDAIVRNHRTLRRELCISRMVIFILLIACTVFCAILYLQQVPNGKNNDMSKDKANETFAGYKAISQEATKRDVQTNLVAFLRIKTPESNKSILEWEAYPPDERFSNFTLLDNGESLVIPRGGWYRLGLQITYMEESTTPKEGQIHLAHNITRYSDSYPVLIPVLSVYDTVYQKKPWFKSIFSEVVHVFIKGDRVKVESQNWQLIKSGGDMLSKTFLTVQFVSEIEDL